MAEVQAHANALHKLDKTGTDMINNGHYEKETIKVASAKHETPGDTYFQKRLDKLHELWNLLFKKLEDKGMPESCFWDDVSCIQ